MEKHIIFDKKLRMDFHHIAIICAMTVFASAIISVHTKKCGDNFCLCTESTGLATCQKNMRNFNYIPKLPMYIKRIRFTAGFFPNLTKELFRNISILKLEQLLFSDTRTFAVSSDAFSVFPYLRKLEFTRLSILQPTVVAKCLSSVSRTIEKLFLHNNKWTSLPKDIFNGLQNSNISHIKLNNNRLQRFDGSILLAKVPYVKRLELTQNNIYTDSLDLHNMKYLSTLYLGDNALGRMPDFCDFDQSSLLPRLRSLNLNNNGIKKFPVFKCLPYLWKLTLDYNNVKKLYNNTFAELSSLQQLSLKKLISLKTISTLAFNVSALEKLWFVGNSFHFDKNGKYDPYYLFKFCPNLTFLELSNNYLPSTSRIFTILYPLTNLRKLVLQGTALSILYKRMFERAIHLEELILSGNSISSWSDEVFSKLTNLRKLYLNGNDITALNKTSISHKVLSHLTVLNLGNNPYSCNCKLLWFRDWLKSTNISLTSYPKYYTCRSPQEWKFKQIADFNLTQENCTETSTNPWITVAPILTSFGVLCVLIVVFTYLQLPTIKNIIYMLKLRYSGHIRQINQLSYTFDAFVVFCSADESWVFETFMHHIEYIAGLSLCIPHRNFIVGGSHAENIEEGMKNSKKLVVILSNEFAKDEWCQWQVEMVQERLRQKGKESVVLILLYDINSKHMTSSLRSLLNRNSYASWGSGKLRKNLFWKVVISALKKPFGNPPVAVN